MPDKRGANILLDVLWQEGISIIFGNPGSTELPLMSALATDDRFRYVLGLNEAVVLSMADGYAQASGRPAMVNLHAAPGVGNALGMLYNARKSGTPLLVTAGQHDQEFAVTEPSLWGDTVEMARPYVKWADEIRDLSQLPRMIHRAITTALAPPTGPVFLSLPMDVLIDASDVAVGAPTRIAPLIRGDHDAIERAAALLLGAQAPVIIAGDAVSQSRAHQELAELIEIIGAPVYLEGMANTNVFPSHHPLFRAPLSRTAASVRQALEPYDVLFSVGGDLLTLVTTPDQEALPPGKRIIHLDTNPWELGKNYAAEVALLCDPKGTLPEITSKLRQAMSETDIAIGRKRRAAMEATIAAERRALDEQARAAADGPGIKPLALMMTIGSVLPDTAVIVDETISSGTGLRRFFKAQDPQGFFGVRGGGIGWGLSAAIGVKLALPQRQVVALVGDGSAMYAVQALWTAAHERLPITFVILNNRSYSILKERTRTLAARLNAPAAFIGMDLTQPQIDFVGIAQSLGVAAVAVDNLEAAAGALQNALTRDAPLLIDVALAPAA